MRRREPATSGDERPKAPLWIRQMNFAARHFIEAGESLQIGGPWTARWRKARDEWCLEQGCWQSGKSCAEVFAHSRMERPCGADERASS